MRGIKFRVWDSNLGAYAPIGCVFGFLTTIDPESTETVCTMESEDFVIEQSTGLHDRNGVEIYENDLWEYRDFVYVVVFKFSQWMFKVVAFPNESNPCPPFHDGAYWGEVIGNVNEGAKI